MLRNLALCALAAPALALLAPSVARAEAPVDAPPGWSPTWDMTLEELQAIGLGQSRGNPVPARRPPGLVDEVRPQQADVAAVIFVQFEAITLMEGFDDSHNDISEIAGGDFAGYGGDASARAAVIEAVRIDWAPYNVLVTDTRPTAGDYTMNVTTPTNPFGGGVLGIAPLDCSNMFNKNNITFAFHGAGDGFPAPIQATTIGQEVAHSYGLEHVDDPTDIMNPVNSGGDPSFRDECLPVVQGGACPEQHEPNCGSGFSQNAHQDLLDLFGPAKPDTEAPLVQIVAPGDGASYPVGADFEIVVMATDDNAVQTVQLFNGAADLNKTDMTAPFGWDVADIPAGDYAFTVKAIDLAGNEAMSNVVHVHVGDDPPDDSGGSASADGTGDGGGDTEGDSDPGQDGGEASGCGCTSDAPAPSGGRVGLLALVAALGLRRRRR